MVLVKSLKFLYPFCFGQISLENVFGAVLDGKQAILDKRHFSKGVVSQWL